MRNTYMAKKKGTFRYLFNKGEIYRSKNLSMYFIKRNKNINTFGICVSKKNGNSVSRNKIKRWVREVYKEYELSLKKGITIIFVLKKDITYKDLSYSLIKEEMKELFLKGNLYD